MELANLELKNPPLALAVQVGSVMFLSHYILPVWDVGPLIGYSLGAVLVLAGLGFCGLGIAEFYRQGTTVDPRVPGTTSSLVCRGVYRVSRNPMYVGFALLLCAVAVFLRSPLTLLGVVFFIVYINRFQIVPEERILQQHFGEEYARYREKVRRWL